MVVTIPDYPYSHATAKDVEGIPVWGIRSLDQIHPKQLQYGEVPDGDKGALMPGYVTSGDYVFVATGTGSTITGARRSAYAAVKRVEIPNSPSYRTDIGVGRLVKQLPAIQALGYATGLSF